MLQSLGNNAECQRLGTRLCLTLCGPVREDSRQIGDLRDPATIVLLLELNREFQLRLPSAGHSTAGGDPEGTCVPLAPRRCVSVRRTLR